MIDEKPNLQSKLKQTAPKQSHSVGVFLAVQSYFKQHRTRKAASKTVDNSRDEGSPIIVPRSEPDPGCVSAEFRDIAETDNSGEADQSPEARKKRAFEAFFREERKRKAYPSRRGWGRMCD